jgi:hypothetical protein
MATGRPILFNPMQLTPETSASTRACGTAQPVCTNNAAIAAVLANRAENNRITTPRQFENDQSWLSAPVTVS